MEELVPLVPGQLVRSKAGRDKGRYYLVYRRIDEKHVQVVEGKKRTLRNPKKKNVIHLQRCHRKIEGFSQKVEEGKINDGNISGYLKELIREKEETQGRSGSWYEQE